MVCPDFQPIRVSEEPVCIYPFRQNPVFTSLRLRSPAHVVPPLFAALVKLLNASDSGQAAGSNDVKKVTAEAFDPCIWHVDLSTAGGGGGGWGG